MQRIGVGVGQERVVHQHAQRERPEQVELPDLSGDDAAWTTTDLTDFPVGFRASGYDQLRWQRDGVVDLLVQNAGLGDGDTLQDVPPQAAQVREWKP